MVMVIWLLLGFSRSNSQASVFKVTSASDCAARFAIIVSLSDPCGKLVRPCIGVVVMHIVVFCNSNARRDRIAC